MAAGHANARDGQLEDALEHFGAVVAAYPDHAKGRQKLAQCLIRLERFAEAAKSYEVAAALSPGDLHIRRGLANACMRMGRYADAAKHFRTALAIDPGDVASRRGLWRALRSAGKVRDAIIEIDRHLEDRPGDLDALNHKAYTLGAMAEWHQARTIWEQIIERGGEDLAAFQAWARTCQRCGDELVAYRYIERRLIDSPGDPDVLYMAACLYLDTQRWNRARALLAKTLKYEAYEYLSRLQLAALNLDLGESIDDLDRLVASLTAKKLPSEVKSLAKSLIRRQPEFARLLSEREGPLQQAAIAAFGHFYRGRPATPSFEVNLDDIDVVYTWVDTDDPVWMARFKATSGTAPDEIADPARNQRRYRQHGEILFSLELLERHFPQARNIFIVTDNQRFDVGGLPQRLQSRLRFIDHTEIIPADLVTLPTFNSDVIEAFLHRIRGLSDVFLYFNDDNFIGAPIERSDLISDQGVPFAFVEPLLVDEIRTEGTLERARQCEDRVIIEARNLVTRRCFEKIMKGPPPAVIQSHAGSVLVRPAAVYVMENFQDILERQLFRHPLRASFQVKWNMLQLLVSLHHGWQMPVPLAKHRRGSFYSMASLLPDHVDYLLQRRPKFFCLNRVSEDGMAQFARLKELY